MKKANKAAGTTTKSGYQMPATSKVDNAIFDAPTILRINVFNPYCLNSFSTLGNLTTQTITIDKATII